MPKNVTQKVSQITLESERLNQNLEMKDHVHADVKSTGKLADQKT